MAQASSALARPVETKETLETLIGGPNFQAAIKGVLPDHLKPERIMKMALVAASKQPTLYKCSQGSVVQSLMHSAELGLDCSGTLGLGYLVPFWSTKNNCYECQFIPGYRGLIELAKRSNDKWQIEARAVFANDYFEFEYGLHPKMIHRPTMGADRGDITYFYCVTRQPGMEPEFIVMSKADIDAIKGRSSAKNRDGKIVGPWVTDYEEMGRKTVTKRHLKYQSLSVEVQKAINLDDEQYSNNVAMANEINQAVGIAGTKNRLKIVPEKEPIDIQPEQSTEPEPDISTENARPPDPDPTDEAETPPTRSPGHYKADYLIALREIEKDDPERVAIALDGRDPEKMSAGQLKDLVNELQDVV